MTPIETNTIIETTDQTQQGQDKKSYPFIRFIHPKAFFTSPDLYKAIAYFLSMQVVMSMVSFGIAYPDHAGIFNIIAVLLAVTLITVAIRDINKRQRAAQNTGKISIVRIILTLVSMLAALTLMTFIYSQLGVTMTEQPNQQSLNGMMSQFPIAMLLTILVVAPIIEEFVFRELLPHATGASYMSFIVVSLVFAALHAPAGLMGWTSYAILTVGFLHARLRGNNLYTAIIIHMLWNSLSVIV